MKNKLFIWVTMLIMMSLSGQAYAQLPVVGLFGSAIKKIITAMDLKVQQLQNRTIGLQNMQQVLENNLSLTRLNDISGWLGKERALYQNYYRELAEVRSVISNYDEVKEVIGRQQQLLHEYQQANALFHRDSHFSAGELNYMGKVYDGILEESLRNLSELTIAVSSFSTEMDDAERLQSIRRASAGMQTSFDHLRQFNEQNVRLSLLRSKDNADRQAVKQLYSLP
jgi:hypothetical protein